MIGDTPDEEKSREKEGMGEERERRMFTMSRGMRESE